MFEQVNFGNFLDRFNSMGRGDQFTYEGKQALFEYLEELESSTGEVLELDVIALCCDYAEYSSLEDYQEQMGEDADPDDYKVAEVGETGFICCSH